MCAKFLQAVVVEGDVVVVVILDQMEQAGEYLLDQVGVSYVHVKLEMLSLQPSV